MLMLRHERETEQKEVLPSMKIARQPRSLPLISNIPSFPSTLSQSGSASLQAFGAETYYTEEDVMQFVENNVKEFKKENVEHYLTRIHQKFK